MLASEQYESSYPPHKHQLWGKPSKFCWKILKKKLLSESVYANSQPPWPRKINKTDLIS